MTQHELIIEYIKLKGSIVPACLNDHDRQLKGDWIGSEAGKRCREMVEKIQGKWCNPYGKQMLERHPKGRFKEFFLLGEAPKTEFVTEFLKMYPSKREAQPVNALF